MDEIWKDVSGYNGKYQVSNFGNIRSFKNGKTLNLKLISNSYGYLFVSLCANGGRKQGMVHRLVCDAFIGDAFGKICNHKDGIKTNNHFTNLEFVTSKENTHHAMKLGLLKVGSKHKSSKLNEKKVLEIVDLLREKMSFPEIAKRYNVTASLINAIDKKRIWKHVLF